MAAAYAAEWPGKIIFPGRIRPALFSEMARMKTLAAANGWATLKAPLRTGALFFLFERRASADPGKLSCAGSAGFFSATRH
jgi:hypothetical protein